MSEEGFLPGTILAGRYQVRRELGRGGMGVVYLCRDLVLDERVARQAARPARRGGPPRGRLVVPGGGPGARRALAPGASCAARDFGALADGTPYLVMDAVPGRSLHEWLYLAQIEGPLPWPIIWSVIDQVLGALAHAHARGVIHGDLKPSNVLVDICSDGGEPPLVHVLDLGLAWLMQDRVDHRLDGSRAREPTVRWGAGTPGWMAPEQIRFAAPHVGPADGPLRARLHPLRAARRIASPTTAPTTSSSSSTGARRSRTCRSRRGCRRDVAQFVKRLMAKRPWHRFEFAGDARRVWQRFEPRDDANATATPLPLGALDERPSAPEPQGAAHARAHRASRRRPAAVRDDHRAARRSGRARSSRATAERARLHRGRGRDGRRAEGDAPLRPARGRGRRRQEPPRRVALRGGPRARR